MLYIMIPSIIGHAVVQKTEGIPLIFHIKFISIKTVSKTPLLRRLRIIACCYGNREAMDVQT